ncbi:unannotated protein [freshwater metagenome]|uniref:Unannotated protein n=1 Tax=freshwater metagenome TaxID=449393 RepID=A0A6J7HGK7_9ZZZZ
MPKSVPNAIVDTGTSAAIADATASSGSAPTVLNPSDSSTTRAGGAASPASCSVEVKFWIAVSDVRIASPIAVASSSCRLSMATLTDSRSVVGGTSVVARPENDTRPRLICAGRMSTNSLAAVFIASNRLGSTSVACIDRDTSSASTTVARSRGTRTSVEGWASDSTNAPSPRTTRPNARCRRQPGRLGTSAPSRATLVNRAAYFCRRRCSRT